jgi:DNA-binding MarR family transcriptional regulator
VLRLARAGRHSATFAGSVSVASRLTRLLARPQAERRYAKRNESFFDRWVGDLHRDKQIVKRLSQRSSRAGKLHADFKITTAMRAVLESLDEGGEQTVPQIARFKKVTRQHIQVLVNRLLELGHVAVRENSADGRSPLVGLTRDGRTVFARMRKREQRVFGSLRGSLSGQGVGAAVATLTKMNALLAAELEEADPDV